MDNWVSDQLYDLIGFSDRHTVDYVLGIAKSSTCEKDIESKLLEIDFPDNPRTSEFASKVFGKFCKPTEIQENLEKEPTNPSYELISKKPKSKHDKKQKHLEMNEEERMKAIEEMKKLSRWKYLEMREPQQIDLMKRQLEDEEKFFQTQNVSRKEKEEFEINKKIYELAVQQSQKREEVMSYKLPNSYDSLEQPNLKERFNVLHQRYKEEKPELPEQELWESFQTTRAQSKFGARDSVSTNKYDLILDSQIDFIRTSLQEGDTFSEDSDGPEIQTARETLPIFYYKEDLLEAIRDYNVLVIVGETGSGKTTQIPQYLHEIGYTTGGKIACTQPRRVAAMSVASRVSSELGCKLGHEVGYSIRFEDYTSEKTIIKYMTDGMLLREFMVDPSLSDYSVIMIDEAHERTLHTDILFGLIKDLVKARKDLKVLISSATMDCEKFAEYFDCCPIYTIPGRKYPVDIYYTKAPEADYVEASVVTILQIHITQPKGDILAFYTGQDDIENAQEMLISRTRGLGSKIPELVILPIYSSLPSEQQAWIFEPTPEGARKVVLATNIAETSVTIDNIIYVIDSGLCKESSYNPRTGMESLAVTPVSKASARQRAGRAGRVAPGKCFRLYTLWSYEHELEENPAPEIQRSNIANVVLILKSLGVNDLVNFDFMDPPPSETLMRAIEDLYALEAMNDEGELTKVGRRMAEFPVDPKLAKCILKAAEYKCVEEVVTIVAMLSVGGSVFYRPKERALYADNAKMGFSRPGGDHITLLNVYSQWVDNEYSMNWCREHYIQGRSMRKARDIREQLVELCNKVDIQVNTELCEDNSLILKSFCSGYFFNTARLHKSGLYKTVKNNHSVNIHPSSVLFKETPKWLLYYELVLTTKEFMRQIAEVNPQWLAELAPHYFKQSDLEDDSFKKLPKKKPKNA